MVKVYSNHETQDTPAPGRLNLLLSSGGWRKEPWVESLPALMAPMGVRAWRAQTGDEAARLIREIPIHIAVVDFALPLAVSDEDQTSDEGGARLLDLLGRLSSPPPTIVVQRAHSSRDRARELTAALNQGAFAVLRRPVDMELMLDAFRRVLRRHYQDRWPDGVS